MRVVVVGATGNVGTSLVRALARDSGVDSVLGVARRRPALELPKTDWAEADITRSDLVGLFRGADAVVHLAWVIQPSRDQEHMRRINVDGSTRLFAAAGEARVPALVYASSIGAYSPAPKDPRVGEGWPTGGIPTSFYGRHKAEVERRLDAFEREHEDVRVVRLRPALTFKREAASGIRRLFAGPFFPSPLARPGFVPVVPAIPGLRFQVIHTDDVAEAYRLAITRDDARGAYNVATEPVLDPPELARLLKARLVHVPSGAARAVASVTWRLRIQPTPPGWIDLALAVPVMDTARARDELGWTPRVSAGDALGELLAGLREGAGDDTPPLAPETGGPARTGEIATGVGQREDIR